MKLSNLTLNLLKSSRQVYLLCTLWFPGPHEQTFKKCLFWDVQGDPAGEPRSQAASLILAWISHIWLHCLTCESPGSPQKPSNGTAVLPDVARLDLCNSTCPSEHGAANRLLQRTAQRRNGLSLSADVVRLWNSMCASSMMSACVYVCNGI